MKIAYVMKEDYFTESGVIKKVKDQIKAWQRSGCKVKLYTVCSNNKISNIHQDIPIEIELFFMHTLKKVSVFRVFKERIFDLYGFVNKILDWKPDLIYFRYTLFYPAWEFLFKKIPTIIEINTDDIFEYHLFNPIKSWYNRFTRSRLLKYVKGFVFVSGELARRSHFSVFNKPFLILGNGIDISRFPELPAPNNEVVQLVFLGTQDMPWHGLDKILQLARSFPEYKFVIIGTPSLKIDNIPSNCEIYGFLQHSGYETILSNSDVAIGTMALHRNKMEEASPIKVREYLAFGLPTIIAYHDTDFYNGSPYILQLENAEDNIVKNLDLIKNFIQKMKGLRVPRREIIHLDINYKEAKRLEFFNHLLKSRK